MSKYYELTIIAKKELPQLPIQPIKEQKGSNFKTLEFYAEPGMISELEKKLKANSLRYMLLAKEPKKELKPKRTHLPKKPFFAKDSTLSQKTFAPSSARGKKVDLKEVDKKIEEILEE